MHKKQIKIAFIGWNQFQLTHVYSLLKALPNAVFIFENKRNSLLYLDQSLLNQDNAPVIIYKSRHLYKLDKLYDVIICQTAFTDIHRFKHAKIAMIQYGYAKEVHNYGAWRSFADLCFVYGDYAAEKINYFSPSKAIGFLRHAEAKDPAFKAKAQHTYKHHLDPNKKTVLYMPTWGELSSINEYLEAILLLQKNYNVLLKIHHNTDMLDIPSKQRLKHKNIKTFGINDDSLQLILISDIVISDYSGAIFDAVYCKKPVVLVELKQNITKAADKIDRYSLEYKMRGDLGILVKKPESLQKAIEKALIEKPLATESLYQRLFSPIEFQPEDLYTDLVALIKGKYVLSQQQHYVRQVMREYYQLRFSIISSRLYSLYVDALAYINIKLVS